MKRVPMCPPLTAGYIRRAGMLAGLEDKLSHRSDTQSVSYPTCAAARAKSVHIKTAKHDRPGQYGADRNQRQRGHRALS